MINRMRSVPEAFIRRPAYRVYQWAWSGLDWLYPPRCGGCGRDGFRWCPECHQSASPLLPPICPICGTIEPAGRECSRCRTSPPYYSHMRSWAVYNGPLRNAIRRLKYRGDMALAEILSRPMIDLLSSLNWSVDFLTPVPIGLVRKAERGYNQASLIALPIALASGIAFTPKALVKSKQTRSQVGLSYNQRRRNVAGAYQANKKLVKGKQVLVIDDVTTSGATLDACAAALFDAGAKQVFALTLARAIQR